MQEYIFGKDPVKRPGIFGLERREERLKTRCLLLRETVKRPHMKGYRSAIIFAFNEARCELVKVRKELNELRAKELQPNEAVSKPRENKERVCNEDRTRVRNVFALRG